MKYLCIITARRDSKGIPGKNWKLLKGKPLIQYSIETAKAVDKIDTICVSTNAPKVLEIAETLNVPAPFVRPEEISLDQTPSHDVLIHAIEHYETLGKHFDAIVLLQPTSPFRKTSFVAEAIELFETSTNCDMVVSVCESPYNPYYNIYLEEDGFIHRSIPSNFTRRQDCPKAFLVNGSIYIINIESLKKQQLHEFEKVVKYEMPEAYSIDLDTLADWEKAEQLDL